MKLEAKYKTINGSLFGIGGAEVQTSAFVSLDSKDIETQDLNALLDAHCFKEDTAPVSKIYRLSVNYSSIASAPEEYNEAFLAKLRDLLKLMEEKSLFAFIQPVAPSECFASSDSVQAFTAAYKHMARRVKDCESLIGLEIPENLTAMENGAFFTDDFGAELTQKHDQYVFGAQKTVFDFINSNNLNVKERLFLF